MLEWLEDQVAYLMDQLGLSEEEAEEKALEEYFDSGDSPDPPRGGWDFENGLDSDSEPPRGGY